MHVQLIKNIRLLHLMENLKTELRQSWLSDGRQESAAEHSWRLSFMVVLFGSHLDQPINIEKALKMAIVHDIVVAEAGYLPDFDVSVSQKMRQSEEQRAISNVKTLLNNTVGQEIYDIWQELQSRKTYESKVIHALDKLEAIIQHNEADISTWADWNIQHNHKAAADECRFDSYLSELSRLLQDQVDRKLAEVGMNSRMVEKAS
jgi:putative hydrolase of HD superfamily